MKEKLTIMVLLTLFIGVTINERMMRSAGDPTKVPPFNDEGPGKPDKN